MKRILGWILVLIPVGLILGFVYWAAGFIGIGLLLLMVGTSISLVVGRAILKGEI